MLKEKEYYIEHGKANIALKTDIEKTADLVCAEGFSNIFFAGSGGSICMLAPFVEILKKRTDIVAYAEEAARPACCRLQTAFKGILGCYCIKNRRCKRTYGISSLL